MTKEPSKTEEVDIMTIEVERQNRNDHFNIIDLKFFHQECGGGSIKIERRENIGKFNFECQRCDVVHSIDADDANEIGIINTALKGIEYTYQSCDDDKLIKFVPR